MTSKISAGAPVRERLLQAADRLFYEEGVNTVGIDRVLDEAGVAKASLYSTFGSKEELVRSYLVGRLEARQRRVLKKLERFDTPRARLLGVFDALRERVVEPDFRGCAFLMATTETPEGSSPRGVCDAARAWQRDLFVKLAREAGVADARGFASRLMLLYDGAIVAATMDRDPAAVTVARAVATTLLDAALGAPAVKARARRRR